MTTPAHGNLTGSSGKPPDGGFEASGLSPEEAERLASAFKPSWELDEAPFTQGNGGLDAAQIEALARDGDNSRIVPPHAPPQRMETHEPEVSVIIDRSITAAEMDAQRPPQAPPLRPAPAPFPATHPAPQAPFAAPVFGAPVAQRVAPVMRAPRSADDSLQLPASLKKSNKGLYLGLGGAMVAAAAVLVIHGAMSSSEPSAGSAPTATSTALTAAAESPPRTPAPPIPPPPPPTTAAPPAPPTVSVSSLPVLQAPQHSAVVPAPRPQYHAPAPPPVVHHTAPRTPPKAAGGGIVRDNPF